MMIDLLLSLSILLFFVYAFYDQFGMDRLKGNTLLKVRLKKQAKTDAVIFMALIGLLIALNPQLSATTLFLLCGLILLSLYAAFIRSPVLVLKEGGFFYGNWYFSYDQIQRLNLADALPKTKKSPTDERTAFSNNSAINQTDSSIAIPQTAIPLFVIDLKNGKRLPAQVESLPDLQKLIAFFGGIKVSPSNIGESTGKSTNKKSG